MSAAINDMEYFLEGSAATSTRIAPTSDVSGHNKKKNAGITFQTKPRITDVHCTASQVRLQKHTSL